MKADDLNKPLGLEKPSGRRGRVVAASLAGIAAVALLGAGAWLLIPRSGGPTLTAAIDTPRVPKVVSGTPTGGEDETGSITITGRRAARLPEPPPDDPSGAAPQSTSADQARRGPGWGAAGRDRKRSSRAPIAAVPLDVYARPSEIDPPHAAHRHRLAALHDAEHAVGSVRVAGNDAGLAPYASVWPRTSPPPAPPARKRRSCWSRSTSPRTDPGPNTSPPMLARARTSTAHWFLGRPELRRHRELHGARFTKSPRHVAYRDRRPRLPLDDGSPRSQTSAMAPAARRSSAPTWCRWIFSGATVDQRASCKDRARAGLCDCYCHRFPTHHRARGRFARRRRSVLPWCL